MHQEPLFALHRTHWALAIIARIGALVIFGPIWNLLQLVRLSAVSILRLRLFAVVVSAQRSTVIRRSRRNIERTDCMEFATDDGDEEGFTAVRKTVNFIV